MGLLSQVRGGLAIFGADDFDPTDPVSLSFVAPLGETITYVQLASGLEPTFNVALIGGVMLGAFISSMVRQEFHWRSFESVADHVKYFLGALLMGVGGILALGCTTGQSDYWDCDWLDLVSAGHDDHIHFRVPGARSFDKK